MEGAGRVGAARAGPAGQNRDPVAARGPVPRLHGVNTRACRAAARIGSLCCCATARGAGPEDPGGDAGCAGERGGVARSAGIVEDEARQMSAPASTMVWLRTNPAPRPRLHPWAGCCSTRPPHEVQLRRARRPAGAGAEDQECVVVPDVREGTPDKGDVVPCTGTGDQNAVRHLVPPSVVVRAGCAGVAGDRRGVRAVVWPDAPTAVAGFEAGPPCDTDRAPLRHGRELTVRRCHAGRRDDPFATHLR